MLLHGSNNICETAEKYYYDFVCGERATEIPREILDHMNKCKGCQENVQKLKNTIDIAIDRVQQDSDADPIKARALSLHFLFIDERVSCNDVKPFLPTLLDRTTEVGIPTPITAHIEKCEACKKDLDVIRKLKLKSEQLLRLSQVFADDPTEGGINCEDTRADLLFTVLMAFRETDGEVLKHVCCCVECRRLLYEHRESLRDELAGQQVDDGFPCQDIRSSDIFDYVIPYGLNPSSDQYAKFRESLTSHLRACPKCLRKMQMLHETLFGIAERAESDIITVFHMSENAKIEVDVENKNPYRHFPVTVEVFDRQNDAHSSEPQKTTISVGHNEKGKILKVRRRLLQTAAIVAIAAITGMGLLFNSSTVQATYFNDIEDALDQVRNVHVTTLLSYTDDPIQEQWVSRDINLYLNKTNMAYTLLNFSNRKQTIKNPVLNVLTTTSVLPDMIEKQQRNVFRYLNLIPSIKQEQINENYPRQRNFDGILLDESGGKKTFVLTIVNKTKASNPKYKKFIFSINSHTNLPTSVEFWQKTQETQYSLKNIYMFDYPSREKIEADISNVMKPQHQPDRS